MIFKAACGRKIFLYLIKIGIFYIFNLIAGSQDSKEMKNTKYLINLMITAWRELYIF